MFLVPNVPCGVERVKLRVFPLSSSSKIGVPNVPCGVERLVGHLRTGCVRNVPNVPCGVESWFKVSFVHLLEQQLSS